MIGLMMGIFIGFALGYVCGYGAEAMRRHRDGE